MNQNYNCMPFFVENIGAMDQFFDGQSSAAEKRGLPVQWCYATPAHALATLRLPAITNMRVSHDFFYGGSYDVGQSSLLTWAVNIKPSKDTFWTSANIGSPENASAILGVINGACSGDSCPPDHGDEGAMLHTILALLTTGPVGFSDAVNKTNAQLLLSTCTADGTLLKPSKPATTIDAALSSHLTARPQGGYILGSYAGPPVNLTSSELPSAWSHTMVSHQLSASWSVTPSNFWPPLASGTYFVGRWESGGSWHCEEGDAIASCVTECRVERGADAAMFELPAAPTPAKSPASFLPTLVTVVGECAIGKVALLGELSKFVTLSPQRFSDVSCTASTAGKATVVEYTLSGAAGEAVPVTLLNVGKGTVLVRTSTLPASGRLVVRVEVL